MPKAKSGPGTVTTVKTGIDPRKKAPDVSVAKEVAAAEKALAPAVRRLKTSLDKLKPKSLPFGAAADLLYDLKQVKSQLNSAIAQFGDVVDPAVKMLEEHFVDSLKIGEASGVQGLNARVQITESVIPVVEAANWQKLYSFIARTKSFELLNRAINRAAVQERWEQKKQIPGVSKFHAKKVSCTKLGGKR
jgi:hypothetical protein